MKLPMSTTAEQFKEQRLQFLRETTVKFVQELSKQVGDIIGGVFFDSQKIEGYSDFVRTVNDFIDHMNSNKSQGERYTVPEAFVPYAKRALIERRLQTARLVEDKKSMTRHAQIQKELESRLVPFDMILHEDAFKQVKPARMPQLTDFLTLEHAEKLEKTQLAPRSYNEKTKLLLVISLVNQDLDFYRAKCGMRGVPLTVAFMDIDKFKDFNTQLGNPDVDRYVLPPFATTLEAHIYGRGTAYQHGGDEYAVILPNTDKTLAVPILRQLQDKVRKLSFRGTDQKIILSIGVCEINNDTPYTNVEIEKRAEAASKFAKDSGRNRIATYRTESMERDDLYVPD